MKLCKIIQKYPDKPYICDTSTHHVVFETDEEELELLRKLNQNKNDSIIKDFSITEVNLDMCSLTQIGVGLSMKDFTKLIKFLMK
jgi:hypothetical protein